MLTNIQLKSSFIHKICYTEILWFFGRLSTQNSDDWTSGWDTWGQDNHSTETKTKKSSKGKASKSKRDDQKSKLIDFGAETEETSKKSALSDAWDNDGWETLNKDD